MAGHPDDGYYRAMLKVTATIRRGRKIIGRATATGDDDSVEPIKLVGEEASRQAKAHDIAIKSRRQSFRQKRKPKAGKA